MRRSAINRHILLARGALWLPLSGACELFKYLKKNMLWLVLLFVLDLTGSLNSQRLDARNIVVVILNQPDPHDEDLAYKLLTNLHDQAKRLKEELPPVHITTKEFHHPGAWTIIPLLPWLRTLHGRNISFTLFCQSTSKIDLEQLLKVLQKLNPNQEKFLGHALYDRDVTIIHHFASPKKSGKFKYPSFAAGFIFSEALLRRLTQRLTDGDFPKHPEFSIDASFELALYIWNEGKGVEMTHSDALCVRPGPHCVSMPLIFKPCGNPVPKEEIFFAVKTCSKFHNDRLPVVKNTWGKHATLINYFSDLEDMSLGTVDLGVPNTKRGHCAKTLAIVDYVHNLSYMNSSIKWLVIADDDTILSVGRLQWLLSCYDPSEKIAIGERYGYNVALPGSLAGYNYITGGGGMVFSISTVRELIQNDSCVCPSNTTPDDMYLGICLSNLNIPITHNPRFHQARPTDYAEDYLISHHPVSFHKHWMVDPFQVYIDWFQHIDKLSEPSLHSEL